MTAVEHMQAWCECGHITKWHFDNGHCAYREENLNGTGDCDCAELRLGHVEAWQFDIEAWRSDHPFGGQL